MSRREEEDRAFGDAVYDAWRSGHNPDLVDRDQFDNRLAMGAQPEEIGWRDCYPNHGRPREEEPEQMPEEDCNGF